MISFTSPLAIEPVTSFDQSVAAQRRLHALVPGGAHTYARVDKEGTYHTLWSGDLSEERQDTAGQGSHNPH